MTRLRGMVIKTQGRWMWVATADRRFMRFPLPSQGVEPGQEVWVTTSDAINSSFTHRWALVASLLIVLLFGTVLAQILPSRSTVAYVALDINPSLELAVNSSGRVTEVIPLNQDAQLLLKDLSVTGKGIYQSLDLIIQESKKEGYISPDKENLVLLTLVTVRTKDNQLDASQVKEVVLSRMAQTGVTGKVGIQTASLEQRERARQEGISVNTYLIINKVSSKGLSLVYPEEGQAEVKDIVEKLATKGVSLEELFEDTGVSLPRTDNSNITKIMPEGTALAPWLELENEPQDEQLFTGNKQSSSGPISNPAQDSSEVTPTQLNGEELNYDSEAENETLPTEAEENEVENDAATPSTLEDRQDDGDGDYTASENVEVDQHQEDTDESFHHTDLKETIDGTQESTTPAGDTTDTDVENEEIAEEDEGEDIEDNHEAEPVEKDDSSEKDRRG